MAETIGTIDRLVEVLGFHDVMSFIIALILVSATAAFIVSGIVFLIKSQKARRAQIEEAVLSVQKPQAISTTLSSALKNTRSGFMAKLSRLFSSSSEISDQDFVAMEAILFTADIGVKTAQLLLDGVRDRLRLEKSSDRALVKQALKDEMHKIFDQVAEQAEVSVPAPKVFMLVGVNGAGKTTSIAKLGAQFRLQGKKVYFGAGDTFRAAAVSQLAVWSERVGAVMVSGKENSDSASVLFDAISQAKEAGADVVLCDTAGRLHTKSDLMDELRKVSRVMAKAAVGAPHEVLLVIDASMGQNALLQAREFAAATKLSGVILSKLDGTAKGGIALGIVNELKVPIKYVGVGEKIEDLKKFDADQFIDALFDEVSDAKSS